MRRTEHGAREWHAAECVIVWVGGGVMAESDGAMGQDAFARVLVTDRKVGTRCHDAASVK